jgi:hypothetical protein
MPKKDSSWRWPVALLLVAGAIAAGIHFGLRDEPLLPPTPAPFDPVLPIAEEPVIRHPIEAIATDAPDHPEPADEPAQPLPAMEDSDAAFLEALLAAVGEPRLVALLRAEHVIARIVATVDNLPQAKVGRQARVAEPLSGTFALDGDGDSPRLGAGNHARYTPLVAMADQVDTARLVALYVRYYPLFQRAYRELGYPQGHFNDRLVEVVEHMLDFRAVPDSAALVRPRVFYEFVDPDLEALSAGHKLLMRMGPRNAATLQAKLREFRDALTGQTQR